MLHPAPTSVISPTLARGVLEAVTPESAGHPAFVTVSFPNTSYEVHLRPVGQVGGAIGKRIVGVIRADARRVDIVDTGGKYVEPVFGRPRRVQGRVVGRVEGTNSIVVDAGFPIHLRLTDARQRAADFPLGELVSTDVMDGATISVG